MRSEEDVSGDEDTEEAVHDYPPIAPIDSINSRGSTTTPKGQGRKKGKKIEKATENPCKSRDSTLARI